MIDGKRYNTNATNIKVVQSRLLQVSQDVIVDCTVHKRQLRRDRTLIGQMSGCFGRSMRSPGGAPMRGLTDRP